MKDRIKQIRKSNNLTQQEFASRLGVSRSGVASYESGEREPISAVIALICREFGINEDWLRYGKGPMNRPVNRNKEIENFMNEVLRMESEDFRRRLISVLTRLDEDEWELLESMALKLAEESGQKKAQANPQPGRIIKIAGRDGSLEEHALTDEDANEYMTRIDQLPDAGDDL